MNLPCDYFRWGLRGGGVPGGLTLYRGSLVRRLSSRNSSWMLVTSATVLSVVQRGGWAVPLARFTSEYGTLEGVLNAGINLDPKSFWNENGRLYARVSLQTVNVTIQICWPALKSKHG